MISNSLCAQFKRITELTLINWLKILATTVAIILTTIFLIILLFHLTKISFMLPIATMSYKALGIIVSKLIIGTIGLIVSIIMNICISAAICTVYGRTISLIFFTHTIIKNSFNYTEYLFQLLTKHHMFDRWAMLYSIPLLLFIMMLIIFINILILRIAQRYTTATTQE